MPIDLTIPLFALGMVTGPVGVGGAVASTGARVVGGAVARHLLSKAAARGVTLGRLGKAHDAAELIPGKWRVPLNGTVEIARRFEKPPQRWNAGHRGVDLRTNASGTVYAANSGVVYFAGSVAGKPVVSIQHTTGVRTTYEPVIASVKKGETVHSGDVIGRIKPGSAHCPPASCLHWGAKRGLEYIDPLSLLGGEVRLLPLR